MSLTTEESSMSPESVPINRESDAVYDTTEPKREPANESAVEKRAMLNGSSSPVIILGGSLPVPKNDVASTLSTPSASTLPNATTNIQLRVERHPSEWDSKEVLIWFQCHKLDELYNSLFSSSGPVDGKALARIFELRLKNNDYYKARYTSHLNASQKPLLKDFDRFGQLLDKCFSDKYVHRFDIAFSFPGDRRERVSKIAELLCKKINKSNAEKRIFYDKYHQAELARPNLDLYLQMIYRYQTRLIVVFMCDEYKCREWCGLESRAIRGLLKTQQDDRIMLLTFDGCTIDGVSDIDGYLDISEEKDDAVVADAIYQRFEMLGEGLPPSLPLFPSPLPLQNTKTRPIIDGKDNLLPLLPWLIIVGFVSYCLGTYFGR